MNSQDVALIAAGVIGISVAVAHGIIMQRRMIEPIEALVQADGRMKNSLKRLLPVLLHFSTFNWFVGGLALIAAAFWSGQDARLVAGLLVGSSYLFGAIGNCRATRGRHPGWVLYAVALALIAYSLS